MNKYALIVGINKYDDNKLKNLDVPDFNAQKIASSLDDKEEGTFEVKLLPEKEKITLKELKDEIVNLFYPKGQAPDTALLYFSGYVLTASHGIQEVFLATSDSDISSERLGLSLQWLKKLLQESPVKKQIIILDCCHNEDKSLDLDKLLPGNQIGKDRFCIVAFNKDYTQLQFNKNKSCSLLTTVILGGLKAQREKEINNNDLLIETIKKYEENLKNSGDFQRIYFGKSIVFFEDEKQSESKSTPEIEFKLQISEYSDENTVDGSDKIYAAKLSFYNTSSEEKDNSTDKQDDCPYRGLDYFKESHHEYFYGREELTDQLIEKVRNNNFLAVMGASGSGKSSVLRAGLIYQLKKGLRLSESNDWDFIILQPGKYPFQSLAWEFAKKFPEDKQKSKFNEFDPLLQEKNVEGLNIIINQSISSVTSKVILVVDQFEEVFTLSDKRYHKNNKKNTEETDNNNENNEQTQFIECLLSALEQTDNKLCLVIGIRADFFGKCTEKNSNLAKKIEHNLVTVTPMNEEELRLAISEPAKRKGVTVEKELEDKLIKDVEEEASLPLLQYALKQLWKHKVNDKLTLLQYINAGEIDGILERNANEVLENIKKSPKIIENGETIAKYIFLQLIHLGDGTGDTRKKVKEDEIYETKRYSKSEIEEVFKYLLEGNLILREEEKQSDGKITVYFNLIHDALIRHWSILHKIWLNDYRGKRKIKNNLKKDADDWKEYKEKDYRGAKEFLIKGKELDEAEKFFHDYGDIIELSESELLKEFIEESRKNSNFKKTINILIGCIISVVVIILLFLSWNQWQEEENKIQTSESLALARYSDVLFSQGQKFDALVNGLRAAIPLEKKNLETPPEVTDALRQAIFGVKERNRLEGHKRAVSSISFSDDGKTLASASLDKTIKLWNPDTGENTKTLKGHKVRVNSVSFSHDGKILASGSNDKTIKLWNPDTGENINTLKGHKEAIIYVSFSHNDKILASASLDQTIKLWNPETGENTNTLKGHEDRVNSISFSHDGKILASGSNDSTIKLWNVDTGKEITTLKAHKSKIYSVVFNHDGKILASVSFDRSIKLWDVSNPQDIKLVKSITDHDTPIYSVSFSKDDKTLASAGLDKNIKLWSVKTGKEITTLEGHEHRIYHVIFSPDGNTLASASADNTIKLWDVTNRDITTLRQHNDKVFSVSFSHDGKTLASASDDKTIKLVDVSTGEVKLTLKGHEDRVNSVSFSPDDKTLASGSFDNTIRLWDISTGKEINQLKQHHDWINSVNFSPDGKILASASDDKTIKLWDVNTGEEIKTLKGHEDRVSSVSFSPVSVATPKEFGKTLASGGFDKTIRIWNVKTGENTKTFTGHKDAVYNISFSPDGNTLASASYDNTIKLRDVSTGKVKLTLRAHTAAVYSLSFSPDGETLASGSDDKTIKLWDVDTGEEKTTLAGHTRRVNSLSFSPDGKILASGSDDKTVILWNLGSEAKRQTSWYLNVDELTKRGCDRVSGYLQNNPNVSENDSHLCYGISNSRIEKGLSAQVVSLLKPNINKLSKLLPLLQH